MLNINAPPETFAYRVAQDKRQLGWFFNFTEDKINLFDLIFETKEELRNFPDYYFDWELELYFFFQMSKDLYNLSLLVSNIPFILKNTTLVKKTLKSLNLDLKESCGNYYLTFQTFNFKNVIPNFIFNTPNLIFNTNAFDFWRYYYFYIKKGDKLLIESFLKRVLNLDFVYDTCKINPLFFRNISKKELDKLCSFLQIRENHFLFFIDPTDFNSINQVLKLEKKYGNKIYGLINQLKRLPTKVELETWLLSYTLKFSRDLKPSILENKVLNLEYGWQIYELVSPKDLSEESIYQHNCLEGYQNCLSDLDYRFFSCRKKDLRFSVLFIKNTLKEVKGRFNKSINTFPRNIQDEINYILITLEELLWKKIKS